MRIDDDLLRVAAALVPRQREDATAVELARHLDARHVRQHRRLRVVAATDQQVEKVDPGRAHRDAFILRLGYVLDGERPAELAQDDRLHRPVQRGSRFSRNAATPSWPSSLVRHSPKAASSRS